MNNTHRQIPGPRRRTAIASVASIDENSAKPKAFSDPMDMYEGEDVHEGDAARRAWFLTVRPNDANSIALLKRARQMMMTASVIQLHYRKAQQASVLEAYDAALILADDKSQFAKFSELLSTELKVQPTNSKPDQLLMHVFLYALGAVDTSARKVASLFVRALRPSLDERRTSSEVKLLIEKSGGFKGLAKANVVKADEQEADEGDEDDERAEPGPSKPIRREPMLTPSKQAGKTTTKALKGPRRRLMGHDEPAIAVGAPRMVTVNATLVDNGFALMSIPTGAWVMLRGVVETIDGTAVSLTVHEATHTQFP